MDATVITQLFSELIHQLWLMGSLLIVLAIAVGLLLFHGS